MELPVGVAAPIGAEDSRGGSPGYVRSNMCSPVGTTQSKLFDVSSLRDSEFHSPLYPALTCWAKNAPLRDCAPARSDFVQR